MTSIATALSREQVRDVDRRAIEEYGMSGLVLMENAGRGAADLLLSRQITGPVAVCCGKGNNGGDGFVIARHLEAAGIQVHVYLACAPDDVTGNATTNLAILQAAQTPLSVIDLSSSEALSHWRDAQWIVDALLGTGISGDVRDPYVRIIESINCTSASVLAVDLPSGLDCDKGVPLGVCVRADLTATFVARKAGFNEPSSEEWTGLIKVLPIGVPRRLGAAYNL